MSDTPLERLESWFTTINGSLTAFSGGVDSALVLYLAHRFLGDRAVGVIADSPSLKRSDLQQAKDFCAKFGIQLRIIETQELDKESYASNPFNRCYYCKDTLYETMNVLADEYPGFTILNGTNTDDLGDYRPGLQAAKERSARSPLAECQIDKSTVRSLALEFHLPNWDKPASPCLSSRIPYGNAVTREKLSQIEAAEQILTKLGFIEARVRHFDKEAKIEVPTKDLPRLQQLGTAPLDAIKALGFETVIIDNEGLVSGKLNRALPNK